MILGSLGTVLSTTAMLPHLVHALRHRHPSGSTAGWMVGALSSAIWFAYGIDRHDLLQAAPGFVTVPVGAFLTGWCLLIARRPGRRLTVPEVPVQVVPDLGDTLELPRISA